MMTCREARELIHPYVDGESAPHDQIALETHLLECRSCRAEHDTIRHVVDTVRGSKPLYQPSPSMRSDLATVVHEHRSQASGKSRMRVAIMGGCFAATILFSAMFPALQSERFTSFAAENHLRYSKGSLPLSIQSEKPEAVSSWLKESLSFQLVLPNYSSELAATKGYSLVGARLVEYEGKDVAYLAYTMNGRPISLLVSATASVIPSEGDTYTSGKLSFHFSSERGLKLITWKDRGLSYALVSDLQAGGAESCVVCHGSEAERLRFQNLHPTTRRSL